MSPSGSRPVGWMRWPAIVRLGAGRRDADQKLLRQAHGRRSEKLEIAASPSEIGVERIQAHVPEQRPDDGAVMPPEMLDQTLIADRMGASGTAFGRRTIEF